MKESTYTHWDFHDPLNVDILGQPSAKASMTFIMGARCVDGVVLVADTKVTLSDYSEFDYQKKLFNGIGHVIYGSSGSTSMYELFRGHVEDYVDTHPGEMNYRNAVVKLSRISFKLYKRYNFHPDYYYDLLVALQPPDRDSTLTYISGRGAPQNIDGCCAIGIGQRYATVFLKRIYHKDMNMLDAAELGFFIIKYIEKFKLNMTVGVNDGYPQIWFVPDAERNDAGEKIDYEITPDKNETRDRFNTIQNNVTRRLKNHEKHIRKLFS